MGKRGVYGHRLLILAGLLMLIGAVALTAYNAWDSARAARAAGSVTPRLVAVIHEKKTLPPETDPIQSDMPMPTETLDGNAYIGIIEIPSAGISLPVMRDWSDEHLKISPCRYAGSYHSDDLVICAHNYSGHFDPVRHLSIGAEVYLTTATGAVIRYSVTNMETLGPDDVEAMIENNGNSDSSNDWDLTLFTCHLDGQTRCAVRCSRTDRQTER